ncbi:16S rRNA uridine-516 pseudouridylate synthase [Mycoplasmopsis californica HAZ160_1]|uniref:Pseudouridine synthase n=2 Tax=Mycoplasmopsis californica TaxID=2113 RepID=A0A059XVE8_9BACT|nr:pseudouridine synthase [Mycoplasmopsis californica]AIA29281.1 pseudouridine synthase [Mycoplasmopsis californica]BAP01256.1 16S rRNA uridine-516 pseudouridylate synthase [Mycoplasmopsis californica HAZ160_1]BBG41129.1 16S rRNA uridine-516 pseudouridylate synthase [Mycoplasmopsis californica]BBG41722.1 16S rRNA uridine-516 pseudouridylate synthase [Mycoplasmopsis californica]BBG42316.1 16S rRNA uridine-516 pseudouridylate synthase [Mycoplasmopsis californica]
MNNKKIRIDRYLANATQYSRSQIHSLIKQKRVKINENTVKKIINIDLEIDQIFLDDKLVFYEEFSYFLLNKPAGFVCANIDNIHKTIFDLIDLDRNVFFSVGRLDKDTEGVLIITNDGKWANWVLKPKNHVPKVYKVIVDKDFDERIRTYREPIEIEGYSVKKYKFEFSDSTRECLLTIFEGKFHQVKQMMRYFGYKVVYLQRIKFGNLVLPENLAKGEYIKLSNEEIEQLKEGYCSENKK